MLGKGGLALIEGVAVGRNIGQRPGQQRPVDFARGARRQVVDDGQQRHQGGGQGLSQSRQCRGAIKVGGCPNHYVPDQQLVTSSSVAHRRRGTGNPWQLLQRGLDLS